MGRPRTRNVAMVNGRITVEQMEWLQKRADEMGGNLSAALRQSITDAQLFEMAREDYRALREEYPDWSIPDNPPPVATTRFLAAVLTISMTDSDDLALRE